MSEDQNRTTHTKERVIFWGLWLSLLSPNILGVFLAQDLLTFGQRCLYLLGAVLLYLFGLMLFKRRTFLYVTSAGLLFGGVEIVHLIINQATTSVLFIFTILKSEKGEFFELLSMYWFVVLIFFGLFGVFYFLTHRFVRNEWAFPVSVRISGGLIIVSFFVLSAVFLNTRSKFRNIFNTQVADERTAAWVGVEKVCPINHLLELYHIARMHYLITTEEVKLRDFRFGVEPAANDPETIVLFLIGETSRYDHWSLNGYERATSPLLDARADEILHFDSCYAVANLTTVSVPFMLSRATPNNMKIYAKEKSVVEAFAEAGYRTSWIADQSFNNHFLLRIAHNCDDHIYVTDDGHRLFTDSLLLDPLEKALCQGGRQMIVVHSLGCHFKYSERYPNTFQCWSPDMKGFDIWSVLRRVDDNVEGHSEGQQANPAILNNLRTILINSYDNAILFSDYFINEVITRLQETGRDAVLVYIGDHGENLLDDERNMFLHGTFAGSEYEYHVPLFVWASDSYRLHHAQQIQAMTDNVSKRFTSMVLFHSLLELGDIRYDSLDYSLSFCNEQLDRQEILYGLDANLREMELPIMTPHE